MHRKAQWENVAFRNFKFGFVKIRTHVEISDVRIKELSKSNTHIDLQGYASSFTMKNETTVRDKTTRLCKGHQEMAMR